MKTMQAINEQITSTQEQTGALVVKIVRLTNDVEQLREKLQGEQRPENEKLLRDTLTEKSGDLKSCQASLRALRIIERYALMDKYELIDWEMQNKQANPHDQSEQRLLQVDIMAKINTLSTLITDGKV